MDALIKVNNLLAQVGTAMDTLAKAIDGKLAAERTSHAELVNTLREGFEGDLEGLRRELNVAWDDEDALLDERNSLEAAVAGLSWVIEDLLGENKTVSNAVTASNEISANTLRAEIDILEVANIELRRQLEIERQARHVAEVRYNDKIEQLSEVATERARLERMVGLFRRIVEGDPEDLLGMILSKPVKN